MAAYTVDLRAPVPHLIQFKNFALALASAREAIPNVNGALTAYSFEARLAKANCVIWAVSEAMHVVLRFKATLNKPRF